MRENDCFRYRVQGSGKHMTTVIQLRFGSGQVMSGNWSYACFETVKYQQFGRFTKVCCVTSSCLDCVWRLSLDIIVETKKTSPHWRPYGTARWHVLIPTHDDPATIAFVQISLSTYLLSTILTRGPSRPSEFHELRRRGWTSSSRAPLVHNVGLIHELNFSTRCAHQFHARLEY